MRAAAMIVLLLALCIVGAAAQAAEPAWCAIDTAAALAAQAQQPADLALQIH